MYWPPLFSPCQMSLWYTNGPTLASAPTLWEGGHGSLLETTVMPSTCKILNCSMMHACPVKKVGNSLPSHLHHSDSAQAPAVLLMLYSSWYWIESQLSVTLTFPTATTQLTKCINISKFRSVIDQAICTSFKSPYMINFSLFFPSLCIFASFFPPLPVGAELLSILDETENGFIWEHIQSYAEQAHGAWLGISVKGWATLLINLPLFNPRLLI